MEIRQLLENCPVIPVVALDDTRHAISLARALFNSGVSILEISLRNPAAYDVIKAIKQTLPQMIIGAGTLLDPEQFNLVKEAGADFAVSPGLTPPLMQAARRANVPYLPGAVTTCEIMAARQMGFKTLKFFPAEVLGGTKMLKALTFAFPDVQFCATGGITRANMYDYLHLENVVAVGGTWLAPKHLIAEKDWDTIASLARQAKEA